MVAVLSVLIVLVKPLHLVTNNYKGLHSGSHHCLWYFYAVVLVDLLAHVFKAGLGLKNLH